MRRAAVFAVIALLTVLFFVPSAAAIPHPCEDKPAENTCRVVVDTALDAATEVIGYAVCYYETAPSHWTTDCL